MIRFITSQCLLRDFVRKEIQPKWSSITASGTFLSKSHLTTSVKQNNFTLSLLFGSISGGLLVKISILKSKDKVENPDEHWKLCVGQREVHSLASNVVSKIKSLL